MSSLQPNSDLLQVARQVVWFEEPEKALANPVRFLAYLMTYGTAKHVMIVKQHFSDEDFSEALEYAPPGIFDRKSWAYWHAMAGKYPPPPLPVRSFPV
jgi:hypothetical protein